MNANTARHYWYCDACRKPRLLCGSKKGAPEDFLDHLFEHFLSYYNCIFGDYLWPENNIDYVELADERWKHNEAKLEFRYKITCKSLLEVQA